MTDTTEFHGAKLALLKGGQLVSILRDDDAEIAFPNMWDLPGGGREGEESAEACVLRELREELALSLTAEALIWKRQYVSGTDPEARVWFFVAQVPELDVNRIRLGNEGQAWRMWDVARFMRVSTAVPCLQARLGEYLAEQVEA